MKGLQVKDEMQYTVFGALTLCSEFMCLLVLSHMVPTTAKKRSWDPKHMIAATNVVRRKDMGLRKAVMSFNVPIFTKLQ
jgi:hypothetical protein